MGNALTWYSFGLSLNTPNYLYQSILSSNNLILLYTSLVSFTTITTWSFKYLLHPLPIYSLLDIPPPPHTHHTIHIKSSHTKSSQTSRGVFFLSFLYLNTIHHNYLSTHLKLNLYFKSFSSYILYNYYLPLYHHYISFSSFHCHYATLF